MAEEYTYPLTFPDQSDAPAGTDGQGMDTRPTGDWTAQKPESGSHPNIEDAMEAKERELAKMNQSPDGGGADPEDNSDDLDDSDGFVSQADDPEAQQS